MENERIALLKKLQAAGFVTHELALFLDTHPNDGAALKDHNRFAHELMELKKQYVRQYGPLTDEEPTEGRWMWIDEPWPWEIDCEGSI